MKNKREWIKLNFIDVSDVFIFFENQEKNWEKLFHKFIKNYIQIIQKKPIQCDTIEI